MKRIIMKGFVWMLAAVVLLACLSAFAQEEGTVGEETRTVASESAGEAREPGPGDKQSKEKSEEEATETEHPMAEKPEADKHEAETPEEEKPDESQPIAEQSDDQAALDAQPNEAQPVPEQPEAAKPDENQPIAAQPEEEQPVVEHSVNVRRIMPAVIRNGEPYRLKATLVGFEGGEISIQWQYLDGDAWKDVDDKMAKDPDALTLEVFADADNVNYDWRILVHYA